MLSELKKAFRVAHYSGISSQINLTKLTRNALKYFCSPSGKSLPPLTVYWSINNICNLRCKMCDVGANIKNTNFYKNLKLNNNVQEISFKKYCNVIDELVPFKPMISITSTEPLLYSNIAAAVEYTVKKGMEINITTNGYILPQKANDLVNAGLTRITVSLDGPKSVHDDIRGIKGSFDRACDGINRIKDIASTKKGYNIETIVSYTITNHNYFCLMDFMRAMTDVPIDRINFVFLHYIDQEMAERQNQLFGDKYPVTISALNRGTDPLKVNIKVLQSELSAILSEYADRVSILPRFNARKLEVFFKKSREFMGKNRCMVSWFIAQICADGSVIPYTRCFNYKLGNINEQPFLEIWNGRKMREWREDLRHYKKFPSCSRCDQVY